MLTPIPPSSSGYSVEWLANLGLDGRASASRLVGQTVAGAVAATDSLSRQNFHILAFLAVAGRVGGIGSLRVGLVAGRSSDFDARHAQRLGKDLQPFSLERDGTEPVGVRRVGLLDLLAQSLERRVVVRDALLAKRLVHDELDVLLLHVHLEPPLDQRHELHLDVGAVVERVVGELAVHVSRELLLDLDLFLIEDGAIQDAHHQGTGLAEQNAERAREARTVVHPAVRAQIHELELDARDVRDELGILHDGRRNTVGLTETRTRHVARNVLQVDRVEIEGLDGRLGQPIDERLADLDAIVIEDLDPVLGDLDGERTAHGTVEELHAAELATNELLDLAVVGTDRDVGVDSRRPGPFQRQEDGEIEIHDDVPLPLRTLPR